MSGTVGGAISAVSNSGKMVWGGATGGYNGFGREATGVFYALGIL